MPKIHRTIPPLTEQDVKRFWSKVDIRGVDECWPWKGSLRSTERGDNYGDFSFKGRHLVASRVAFKLHYGEDLGGHMACHRCDNPPCCNPFHLFKGTQKDNRQDAAAKGRTVSGDRHHYRARPECVPRGEDTGHAVMTAITVLEMRHLFDTKQVVVFAELGRRFGCSARQSSNIVHRRQWCHLP